MFSVSDNQRVVIGERADWLKMSAAVVTSWPSAVVHRQGKQTRLSPGCQTRPVFLVAPLQLPPEGTGAHVAVGRRLAGRARRRLPTVGKVGVTGVLLPSLSGSLLFIESSQWYMWDLAAGLRIRSTFSLKKKKKRKKDSEFLWLEIKCK